MILYIYIYIWLYELQNDYKVSINDYKMILYDYKLLYVIITYNCI